MTPREDENDYFRPYKDRQEDGERDARIPTNEQWRKEVGAKLLDIAIEQGWNEHRMRIAIGRNGPAGSATVSGVMSGEVNYTIDTLLNICRVLEIDMPTPTKTKYDESESDL